MEANAGRRASITLGVENDTVCLDTSQEGGDRDESRGMHFWLFGKGEGGMKIIKRTGLGNG